ncbi:hypothetical protein CBS101457_001675 [Exobasidium rhododendri]|nr:hypothetical protein CBS101457_001675 [Exobasidium rhododendri]
MSSLSDTTHVHYAAEGVSQKVQSVSTDAQHPATLSTAFEKENAAEFSQPAFPKFSSDLPWSHRSWLYELMPLRGMYYDFKRRAPFLKSDWTTAFVPKNWWTVVQYIPRMYFINLMPAISYIIDMEHRTGGAYGLNEVILASALAAIVFSVFSVQPLTFVGVTGLINLVNYTQYDLVVGYYGLDRMDYLRVQAWSLIWAAGFHFIVSVFNICDFTRFITDMTSQTFGFYVGVVYIQKGIELLLLEFEPAPLDNSTGWLSVTIAILFTVSVYLVSSVGQTSFLPFKIRYFVSSFAFAAGCIFWTGFSHFPKNSLEKVPIERLSITKSFFPTIERSWFIDFWNIEAKWALVGAPLGFLIMLLFYFDHNVSSVMAQARQFPVKRPAGFHWDFFLLGITTLVSGFLGLPAPNGLVPQCPWSTEALSVYEQEEVPKGEEEAITLVGRKRKTYAKHHVIISRVVENRVAPLIVGLLTLGTMTRPLLVVLGTMPRALFAGIFLLVGWSSIEGNVITSRTLAIFQDRNLASKDDDLIKLKRSKIALFVGIQWIFFAMTIAISQTIAAIGFPVIITLLIPFRYYLVPKMFSPLELRILDAPTADADVVLASIGQETEAVTGQGQRIARDTGIAGSEWIEEDEDEDDVNNDSGFYEHENDIKGREEVHGYRIGHDIGEEEEDYQDDDIVVVRPSEKIAFMSDLGGGSNTAKKDDLPSSLAASLLSKPEQASATAVPATQQPSPPPKSSKRNKSATQSWWGLGGSKAVDRAPSPVKTATPAIEDTPTYTLSKGLGKEREKEGQESSQTADSKKWLASKGKVDESGNPTAQEASLPSPMSDSPTVEALSKSPVESEQKAIEGEAVRQHFSAHLDNLNGSNKEASLFNTSTLHDDLTPKGAPALDLSLKQFSTEIDETPTRSTAAAIKTTEHNDEGPLEKAAHKIEEVLAINTTDNTVPKADGKTGHVETERAAVPATENVAIPVTGAAVIATEDTKTKRRREAFAAAVETQRIADERKQKEKDNKRREKEAKEAEKKRKEQEKRKAKQDKEDAKRKEKEDAKRRKQGAVLVKRNDKDILETKRREEKEAAEKKHREDVENGGIGKKKEVLAAGDVATGATAIATTSVIVSTTKRKQPEKYLLDDETRKVEEEHAGEARAAEEAQLVRLNREKVGLEHDVHVVQATKAKELDELEVIAQAKETELSQIKEREEAELAALVANNEAAQANLSMLQDQKERETAELEETRKAKEQEVLALQRQKDATEKEHTESEEKKTAELAAVAAVVASKEAAERDVAKLREDKERQTAELEEARKTKEQEVLALQEEKEATDKEHAESKAKKEAELAAVAAAIASKEAAERDVAKLQEDKERQTAELEEARKTKEQEVLALQKEKEATDKEHAESKAKKETELAAVAAAIASKEAAERDVAKLQEDKEKQAAELEEARKTEEKELSDLQVKKAAVEKESNESKATKEAELAALATAVASKAAAEREVAQLQEDKEKQITELEEARKSKGKELDDLQSKKAAAEKESDESKATKEVELAALAAAVASKAAAEKELAQIQESKDKQAADLAAAKKANEEELAEMKSKKEALEKENADTKSKEEAALAALIASQRTAEEEIASKEKVKEELVQQEAKKRALDLEIAELESKARSTRLFLAPAKVSRSTLTPLLGQVAGHEASVYTLANEALIVKSCSTAESNFYQSVLIHHSADTRKHQAALLSRLRKYLPTYHGTIELISDDASREARLAVILENLTRGYKHPNVLDIKLGKQLWDEDASEEKKGRMIEAAKNSTSLEMGLRLTGWQIWDEERGEIVKVGKKFGKTVQASEVPLGLRSFFGVASTAEAARVSEISGKKIKAVNSAESSIERILHDAVVPSVKEIIDIVKKLEWRVRGGSILIVYEGDEKEVKSFLDAKGSMHTGRYLTDTDQLIDTHDLANAGILSDKSSRRIVDVRLIDFAHASFGREKGIDDGYLAGLESTKYLLEDLTKALRKGTLHSQENGQSGGGTLMASLTKGLFSRGEDKPVNREKESAAAGVVMVEKIAPKEAAVPAKVKGHGVSSDKVEEAEVAAAGGAALLAADKSKFKEQDLKEDKAKPKTKRHSLFSSPRKSELVATQRAEPVAAVKEKKGEERVVNNTSGGGFKALFSTKPGGEFAKKDANLVEVVNVIQPPRKAKAPTKARTAEVGAVAEVVAVAVTPAVSEEGTGKGKEKERVGDLPEVPTTTSDKLDSFWKVEEPSVMSEEVGNVSSLSTGPRKLLRVTNPVRGAGKSPPAIQYRSV